MKLTKLGRLARVATGVILLFTISGCIPDGCLGITPPPEAVLAGTWTVNPTVTTSPPITNWTLTFDEDGNLTQVRYNVDNATVTWADPPSATNVEGSSLFISGTRSGGGGLSFEGTLNATNTAAVGRLISTIIVGGATIQIDQGSATLTKQ